jgi:hypothetical protein
VLRQLRARNCIAAVSGSRLAGEFIADELLGRVPL